MKISLTSFAHWTQIRLYSEDESANFLDPAIIRELRDQLRVLASLPKLRCLLLEVDHCSGASLENLARAKVEYLQENAFQFAALLQQLHDFPRPVLGWARGSIQGGGVGLVAACDSILAATGTTFSLPETTMGIAPILIAPWLIRRIGSASFRGWALSAQTLDLTTALHLGLVDSPWDTPGFPSPYARILRSSPLALQKIKEISRFQAPDVVTDFTSFVLGTEIQTDLTLITNGQSPVWRKKETLESCP